MFAYLPLSVLKASYNQFLKGTYFDSTSRSFPLEQAICPASRLFHLYNLKLLASSPLLERTHALRMRIPGRLFVQLLHTSKSSLPSISLLDLSTSGVSMSDVRRLLRSLPLLRHLILDRCGTLDDAVMEDWTAFGRSCMLICNGLAAQWQTGTTLEPGPGPAQLQFGTNAASNAGSSGPSENDGGTRPLEVRIIPRASALRTLAVSVPSHMDVNERLAFVTAFQRGWSEGVAMFNETMRVARQSRAKGVLTLRSPLPDEAGNRSRGGAFPGMVVVDDDGEFARLSVAMDEECYPVVCLAGQRGREEGIEHAEGCAHAIGWDIWEDTL
ncbi:hypothetical protein B0F90DRAFT_1813624 [Multifurca ochricompacta]|uniref:Uncharacterized protein n=1 Tax=Multifurca ochricompacta TaxID=376703 RepID=A0AAD4ME61_9AGAM|nr:hypothetical protein B0F90DRAFT_1813624 [Multifurca ochricompacta]